MSNSINLLRGVIDGDGQDVELSAKPKDTIGLDYAVWRFLKAIKNGDKFGSDHAVLLRQVARWGNSLFVGRLPEEWREKCSLAKTSVTDEGFLTALPFLPSWISADNIETDKGIDFKPVARRIQEEIPAEAYIESFGYKNWKSQAQKEAVWDALHAPPKSTSLIALPTGAGKSLCFQILSKFGQGVTVVVVPTVALAIDQCMNAMRVLSNIPGLNPLSFAASDPRVDPVYVCDQVRNGSSRLLFTSPESIVSGRLRGILEEMVSHGRLENLVIDEAHMIESWGAYFRVDFQMLSILRRKWVERPDSLLRTYLLSATFTPQCRVELQNLFCDDISLWREFVSQRLRPEMVYYLRKFRYDEERKSAVKECIWHLPRPAIFYTTEVNEAKKLYALLQSEGFNRIGIFHGETSSADRRGLLEKWRDDDIDLMVATSAFGLGVDKPDIRSVLHACMPENLHRYYQEVGRGGRDGNSSICILLPTDGDEQVAKGITPKLMRPDTLQDRWEALWETRRGVNVEEYIFDLMLNAKKEKLLGERTWSENVRWNKRLILQLLRAGKIDLLDILYEKLEENQEYLGDSREVVRVKLRFPPNSPSIGEEISEKRNQELSAIQEGLNQVERYLRGVGCIGKILKSLYGSDTEILCGGCPVCRKQNRSRMRNVFLPIPKRNSNRPEVGIVVDFPNPFFPNGKLKFSALIRRLIVEKNVCRFVTESENHEKIMKIIDEAMLNSPHPYLYRVDIDDIDRYLNVSSEEAILIFHFIKIDWKNMNFRRGKKVFHAIGSNVKYMDSSGRYPLESENARFYCTPDYWLQDV